MSRLARGLTTLAIFVALSVVTATVCAQSVTDPERARRAHAAFSEGVRAFEARDYETALEAFRRANTIVPDERVQLPIATTLENLGRLLESRTAYRRALASSKLDDNGDDQARAGLERVENALTELSVTSNVSAGRLQVDGIDRCALPCAPLWLIPGPHELALHYALGVELRTIELLPGPQELHLSVILPAIEPSHTFPSWLGYTGMGLAALGTAGAIGFGVRTEALRDDYVAEQNESLRDQAVVSRTLTNVSIGIAVTGAAVVVADLIWALLDEDDAPVESRAALSWRF